MQILLESLEPKNRENCLCGSAERYKNCCKSEWRKHNFTKKIDPASSPAVKLKHLRAHITWYRLCHGAHTAPLIKLKYSDGGFLKLDIDSLNDLVRKAWVRYREMGIIESYPVMLGELWDAIEDQRWKWKITTWETLFHLVIRKNRVAAMAVLAKYKWQEIDDSELLEAYLDAYANKLGGIEVINIASKILSLTDSDSSKFHYRFLIAMQYFMSNESDKAKELALEAMEEYEKIPVESRDSHGRMMFALSMMHLGQLLSDHQLIRRSINLFVAEATENYKSSGVAEIWCHVGECYYILREFRMAEKLCMRSLSIEYTNLASIYLAKVRLKLGDSVHAKEILDGIILRTLSEPNFFDFAIVRCHIALTTKKLEDIKVAMYFIKKVVSKDSYFKDLIQSLIVALYELQVGGDTGDADSVMGRINRYLTLNPNVAGVGINFNTMIEDYIKRKSKK